MEFLSIAHSDVGIKKNTNQDSVLIKEASTDYGKILLAVVCDGMGGLAKGEVASAALIKTFSSWFEETFPDILYNRRDENDQIDRLELENEMNRLAIEVNKKIAAHGQQFHVSMGTTIALLLMAEGKYYTMNVGDSRVYKLDQSQISQLTKDQTFVQRELDQGRMTPEEARNHPQRNVLLQCVGASEVIIPEFTCGKYKEDEIYMVCSDGFRHVISEEEFFKLMAPEKLHTEKEMRDAAIYCTELNKSRMEKDNISVILVRTC